MEICRICSEEAMYDIFNHELMFEQKKNVKIYIILNNFLYEKLYAPDQHSSYICENCCENLYNSYTFMETVRNSERQLRLEPTTKKIKHSLDVELKEPVHRLDIEEVVPVQFDDIDDNFIAESFEDEEILNDQFIEETKIEEKREVIEFVNHRETTELVTFLDYILEHKEENGQKHVSVRIDRKPVKIREKYDFNVISHSDSNSIYSCLYCVKAFGTLDFLMKHISLCHLCVYCFRTAPTYNDLNEHIKTHQDKLNCPFCKRSFALKSLRPHIKKQHVTNLPNYYSVLIE